MMMKAQCTVALLYFASSAISLAQRIPAVTGIVINDETGQPQAGLILASDLNSGGVFTSKENGRLKKAGAFKMDLPSSAKPGTPIHFKLLTKGWAFVDPFDGRITLEDQREHIIHVSPKGSLALLRGGNRLRFLCRIVASVAMSSGTPELVPKKLLKTYLTKRPPNEAPRIREQLLESMSSETGISKESFINEISSWINDSKRDPGDRALAAWFANDYAHAAEFALAAAGVAHLKKVMAAREEAFWYCVRGWSQLENGEFSDAEESFLSARSADDRLVYVANGLAISCFGRSVDLGRIDATDEHVIDTAINNSLEQCKAILTKNFESLFEAMHGAKIPNDTDEAQALFSLELWKYLGGLDDEDILTQQETCARAEWLLDNTNETRSWDLEQTLFYSVLVLAPYADDEKAIPAFRVALNRAISYGESRYIGANFPLKAGLLTMRAIIEFTTGDVVGYLRDTRDSVASNLQFDKAEAADLAKDACIKLNRLRVTSVEKRNEIGIQESDLPKVLVGENEMCACARALYSEGEAARAAEGHHDIADSLLRSQQCASAIPEYSRARKFGLAANNIELVRDSESSIVEAVACLTDTHNPPLGDRVLSCVSAKELEEWLPVFRMSEEESEDGNFPLWLTNARANLKQATEMCALRR